MTANEYVDSLRGAPSVADQRLRDSEAARVRLAEKVARLRDLVLSAEEQGCHCGMNTEPAGCPWCGGCPTDTREYIDGVMVWTHAGDCPAFSARGVVR